MNREILEQLAEQDIDSTTHHSTIKSALKRAGVEPTKDAVAAVRAQIDDVIASMEEAAPTMTPEEALARAEEIVEERAQDADMPGWSNVVRVVQAGATGKPVRVVIRCADPSFRKDGSTPCVEEREIAAQDVFQVSRCVPCQKRTNAQKRVSKQRAKLKAAKAAAKPAKKGVRKAA